MFGLKALNNVGGPIIEQIFQGRPYSNIKDFMYRCKIPKLAMIALIKSGAFDSLNENWSSSSKKHSRILTMGYYLSKVCESKEKLTLQNFNGLAQRDLIPESLFFQKRVFFFNKYLKSEKKAGEYYVFDNICSRFYNNYFNQDLLDVVYGVVCIKQKDWDKIYKQEMSKVKNWLQENQDEVLKDFNFLLFKEQWEKYASGTLSSWEMESLCFYYHEHELKNVDVNKYGISNFFNLPEEPEVDYFFKRKDRNIPIYKTYKIIGTVLNKNDSKSSISLLTTNGVVNVKFTKEYFAMFGRQISEKQADGTKKVVEKGWFQRGSKVLCTGFRRGDTFQTKSYKHTPTHQLYKIKSVSKEGFMELTHERYHQSDEE